MEQTLEVAKNIKILSPTEYCADPQAFLRKALESMVNTCYMDNIVTGVVSVDRRGPCVLAQNTFDGTFTVDCTASVVAVRLVPQDVVCPMSVVHQNTTASLVLLQGPVLRERPGASSDAMAVVAVEDPDTIRVLRNDSVVALRVLEVVHPPARPTVAIRGRLLVCDNVAPHALLCDGSPCDPRALRVVAAALRAELLWRTEAPAARVAEFDALLYSFAGAASVQVVPAQSLPCCDGPVELPEWRGPGGGAAAVPLAEALAAPAGVWLRPLELHAGAPAVVRGPATMPGAERVSTTDLLLLLARRMLGFLAAVRCYASRPELRQPAVWDAMRRAQK